jgi:hypothetical protein
VPPEGELGEETPDLDGGFDETAEGVDAADTLDGRDFAEPGQPVSDAFAEANEANETPEPRQKPGGGDPDPQQ